jgi:hypothetical protein
MTHGEAGSVDAAAIAEDMAAICIIINLFRSVYIFNFDETAFYRKMSSAKGLAHECLQGTKKAKARLTLALCRNETGTERLPP